MDEANNVPQSLQDIARETARSFAAELPPGLTRTQVDDMGQQVLSDELGGVYGTEFFSDVYGLLLKSGYEFTEGPFLDDRHSE